jgi:L-alanine-DL-glutamate epimerase-like enolase superfamily enzyme
MTKPTDIQIKDVRATMEKYTYRTPMKFGGRVVVDAVLFNVTIDVETRDGRRGRGTGSMPMSNAWAWPSQKVLGDQTLAGMLGLCERVTQQARECKTIGHPLDLTIEMSHGLDALAQQVTDALQLGEKMPRLAQLVVQSPIEAAVHDAYGRALQANSYNVLGKDFVARDLAAYLTPEFAGEYLDQYTLRTPKPRMPLYHLVGALDPLTDGDITQRVHDGLPETLGEWIPHNGLTHLKIKLAGDNFAWDIERVVAIDRVATVAQTARGCREWYYSLDFNEKCANVQYVVDFLNRLNEQSPAAFNRVQYVEQPTNRDLRTYPENRMHAAALIKPVVIDESLIDLESLLMAREQGYSGVALKACKGQTEALLMGAAAQKYQLFLCVQDLTCPGASLIHSAGLSAHVPGVAGIEANSRQYVPIANKAWVDRFPGIFVVKDGTMDTSVLNKPGLGAV